MFLLTKHSGKDTEETLFLGLWFLLALLRYWQGTQALAVLWEGEILEAGDLCLQSSQLVLI